MLSNTLTNEEILLQDRQPVILEKLIIIGKPLDLLPTLKGKLLTQKNQCLPFRHCLEDLKLVTEKT